MLHSDNLTIHKKDGLVYISFPKFDAAGVKAVFSTRLGGVSEGHLGSMNMSLTNGDDEQNVKENYRRLCAAADIDPQRLVFSKQTHTTNLRIVTENDIGKGLCFERDYTDVDGLITNIKGVGLVTHFADCVPLLFFDPVQQVIAASHSGWRGTAGQIGAATVQKMQKHFGCNPDNIIAAIGPCIKQCCYEVDLPVIEQFKRVGGLDIDAFAKRVDDSHFMLDLCEVNRQILVNAGIKNENIDISDICTCCNCDTLHSHRATNGKRGIMAAIITL